MAIRTALVNSLIYPLSAARKPTLSSGAYEKVTSRSLFLAFVACCYSMSAPAQDYTPARTEWGQPDLQGSLQKHDTTNKTNMTWTVLKS